MNLEKERAADGGAKRDYRGVESFEMPDLENPSVAVRGVDQQAGGGWIVGNGLLYKDVEPEFHQTAADFGVRDSGCGDHGGLCIGGEFFRRRENPAFIGRGGLGGTLGVEV